jgi:hypothetical protein
MYGYIPIENVALLQLPYSITGPADWQFERNGLLYGGVEETEFSQAQKAELIALGGGWFATGGEFSLWLSGNPLATLTSFLFEVPVSATRTLVCNLPILTGGSSFVLDVTVRDEGMPERIVQLVCTNQASIPTENGLVPEFDFLVGAIRSDAGLNTLTTQMLYMRHMEGAFDQ